MRALEILVKNYSPNLALSLHSWVFSLNFLASHTRPGASGDAVGLRTRCYLHLGAVASYDTGHLGFRV